MNFSCNILSLRRKSFMHENFTFIHINELFMQENDISMHENEIFMHKNENFAQCMKLFTAELPMKTSGARKSCQGRDFHFHA